MSEVPAFKRARKPEEQQLRRAAILAAAADLFDAEGPHGAGLNAIAARAGFTKSNVYRYFESREEVLLNLLLDETAGFLDAIDARLAAVASGDIPALADAIALSFAERPRLCALISIMAGVLEQNVSEARIIELKRTLKRGFGRFAASLAARLPGASLEDCEWAAITTATLIAGLWPGVNPSPAAANVLAMPEFAHMRADPGRDIARVLRALLPSIA